MTNNGNKNLALVLHESREEGVVMNSLNRLIDELKNEGAEVLVATSFDDCYSIINANTAVDSLLLTSSMSGSQKEENQRFYTLIKKLKHRQENVPVFLLAERKK